MKRYAVAPTVAVKEDQSAEIKRLKRELARVTEERDILKKTNPADVKIVQCHSIVTLRAIKPKVQIEISRQT
jgi:hypothetical protein